MSVKKVLGKSFFVFELLFIFILILLSSEIYTEDLSNKNLTENRKLLNKNNINKEKGLIWKKVKKEKSSPKAIKWEKSTKNYIIPKSQIVENRLYKKYSSFNSLNRSIVFDNYLVGPDISWLVPPGLKWSKNYKFDNSVRGHNRRKKGQNFFGWNGGDAVGQVHYQFLHKEKSSYGLNIGVRSVYQGSGIGGSTSIGEGLSAGFRWDYQLNKTSGVAFGGEQILHFDGLTDTGRDFYFTASKVFEPINNNRTFPLYILTGGIGTGKMAEGNIKGLCSDLFGGSGTEVTNLRSLCWAPIFSISKIYNESVSTFFEYNSKWFILGTSIAPLRDIPLRGTFAIQLSDHIENYKLNNPDNLKWVFRLSLGF